jgi:4-hydroxy-tetrahydrodipicolinate synthase
MHDICKLCLDNNFAVAGALQIKYLSLFSDLLKLDVNPTPIKAAMNLMGKNVGGCRMPLYEMDSANLAKLRARLESADLLK